MIDRSSSAARSCGANTGIACCSLARPDKLPPTRLRPCSHHRTVSDDLDGEGLYRPSGTYNVRRTFRMRTFLLVAVIAASLAGPAPAQAESLILSDAYALARKVGKRLARYYQAETWKVRGCYKINRSTGRCAIRLYGIHNGGGNCAYAITIRQAYGQTRSSYYADNCS